MVKIKKIIIYLQMYKRDRYLKHVPLANLTRVKTDNFQPIPVVQSSSSREESLSSSCDFESQMPEGCV